MGVGFEEDMVEGEDGQRLCKESPLADDGYSDGEDGGGRCWFTPRGRGRWRFVRVERKESKCRRVASLTQSSQFTVVGGDDASCLCCCGPRWKARNSPLADNNDGDGAAARDQDRRGRISTTKGKLLRKFGSYNDLSPLQFSDGGQVSPALSPLPVRTTTKMERDKKREASVPIWQRRAVMFPIKALDLRS